VRREINLERISINNKPEYEKIEDPPFPEGLGRIFTDALWLEGRIASLLGI